MTIEEKRVALYRVLKELCWTLPASTEAIAAALEYDEPKLEAYLEGMVSLCELEKATVHISTIPAEDDGFGGTSFNFDDDTPEDLCVGYRLTEFGQKWTDLMLAGAQPSER